MIDSHVHVWDTRRHDHPWLRERPDLPARAGLAAYAAARTTPRELILVEAAAADPVAEHTRLARMLGRVRTGGSAWATVASTGARSGDGPAEEEPDRVVGVVAGVVVTDGEAATAARAAAVPGTVGLRQVLQGVPVSSDLAAGLAGVRATGLPFDACVSAGELPALAGLLARLPGLVVVVDHAGKPPLCGPDPVWQAWRAGLTQLAQRPGTTVKLSGLRAQAPPGTDAGHLAELAIPVLVEVLDLFGADRALLGSDWPVSAPGDGDPDEVARLVLGEVARELGLSATDRALLSDGTARRVYGLA